MGRVHAIGKRGSIEVEDTPESTLARGVVALESRRTPRIVSVQLRGAEPLEFTLPIPAKPGRELMEWSTWEPVREIAGALRRFRVETVD